MNIRACVCVCVCVNERKRERELLRKKVMITERAEERQLVAGPNRLHPFLPLWTKAALAQQV